jgi:hypothetical protein
MRLVRSVDQAVAAGAAARSPDSEAGSCNGERYRKVRVDGRKYFALALRGFMSTAESRAEKSITKIESAGTTASRICALVAVGGVSI